MKCPLQGLDSTAVIVLKSRLWNSTFLEVRTMTRAYFVPLKECLSLLKQSVLFSSQQQDYASYNYLDIIVKASISLDVSANNIVLKNAETQVTQFPKV